MKAHTHQQQEAHMLDAAQELYEAGLCVIPLQERSKRPALASWKPYQKARPAPADLQRWFGQGDLNLAVVCGDISGPPGLSLAVLDFDQPGFEEWAAEQSDIVQDTWISASGREGGRHVWLLVPGGTPCSSFRWGDIKAEGGYIVAPPSLHPGGRRYRWLQRAGKIATVGDLTILGTLRTSRWAASGLTPPPVWPGRHYNGLVQSHQIESLRRADPDRLLRQAVRLARGGQRNELGFWLAVQLRDSGCSWACAASVLLRYRAAVVDLGDHPYTSAEALRSVRSAYSHPRCGPPAP